MSSRAAEISANLQAITARIVSAAESSGRDPEEITLIAVTKTFPVSDVKILYELGVRDFGENRDQEGSVKFSELAIGDSFANNFCLYAVGCLTFQNRFLSICECAPGPKPHQLALFQ